MMETADSVRQYGVLVPAIARPDPEGGYELVAGHRRHRASELAEKETIILLKIISKHHNSQEHRTQQLHLDNYLHPLIS